jgi:hypothetical protein
MKFSLSLSNYILPFPFFISLFIGLMMCYVLTPPPKIVLRHPTPENAKHTIYQDKSDNCYKYEVDEVSCPHDKNLIKEQPINN